MRKQPERSNIAGAINAAHAGVEAAKREGARYATECGRLLRQAKETVPHGGWDAWLRLNTVVSPRTAQLYMRIARHVEGDPAKAQRVAGLSLREAAVEATRPKVRKPLSKEGQASLDELNALWDEALENPHWKEAFARELYRRGEVSLEQRNRIIKGAWAHPDLTDDQRDEAARRVVEILRDQMPAAELRAIAPMLGKVSSIDLAIAIGDTIEKRRDAKA